MNGEELSGTVRSIQERSGTVRSVQERLGTPRNVRVGTQLHFGTILKKLSRFKNERIALIKRF
jgi:hypothetical protein